MAAPVSRPVGAAAAGDDLQTYLRALLSRASELRATLRLVDGGAAAAPAAADGLSSSRWQIIATQLLALVDTAALNPALSSGRSQSSSSCVYPLSSGYSPADELRVRAIPEVDTEQAEYLQRFLQQQAVHDEGSTAASLAARLNAYNDRCVELKAACAQQQLADSSRSSDAVRRIVSSVDVVDEADEELQRTLRYLVSGRLMRPTD